MQEKMYHVSEHGIWDSRNLVQFTLWAECSGLYFGCRRWEQLTARSMPYFISLNPQPPTTQPRPTRYRNKIRLFRSDNPGNQCGVLLRGGHGGLTWDLRRQLISPNNVLAVLIEGGANHFHAILQWLKHRLRVYRVMFGFPGMLCWYWLMNKFGWSHLY